MMCLITFLLVLDSLCQTVRDSMQTKRRLKRTNMRPVGYFKNFMQ